MGYRCKMPLGIERECTYRVMEVVMMKRGRGANDRSSTQLILIENQLETLNFVQESMDEIINNIIRVNKMAQTNKKVDESAKLFEKSLDPLFSVMAERTQGSILDKLSISLKKALILMAMDRYKSNKDSVCKALGISPDKLDGEMALCGIVRERHAA